MINIIAVISDTPVKSLGESFRVIVAKDLTYMCIADFSVNAVEAKHFGFDTHTMYEYRFNNIKRLGSKNPIRLSEDESVYRAFTISVEETGKISADDFRRNFKSFFLNVGVNTFGVNTDVFCDDGEYFNAYFGYFEEGRLYLLDNYAEPQVVEASFCYFPLYVGSNDRTTVYLNTWKKESFNKLFEKAKKFDIDDVDAVMNDLIENPVSDSAPCIIQVKSLDNERVGIAIKF